MGTVLQTRKGRVFTVLAAFIALYVFVSYLLAGDVESGRA